MSQNIREERLRWVLPIINRRIKIVDAVKVCPYSQRSIERWLTAYRQHGEAGLEPKSTRPRSNPKDTPIRIKEKVIQLRKETKLAALKIHWKLEKEGVPIHERTIGKILKAGGLVRKYRIRRIRYKYIKAELKPGELVEIDVKWVPQRVANKRYFQFTAIDCASRWRFIRVYEGPTNLAAVSFLRELIQIAPFKIEAVKTDNAAYFTNRSVGYLASSDPMNPRLHLFDLLCLKEAIQHYLIDPGKPQQNGKVERSHRTDQEMFYERNQFKNIGDLEEKIKSWNTEYNNLEHCGLNGKTPNEMLKLLIN